MKTSSSKYRSLLYAFTFFLIFLFFSGLSSPKDKRLVCQCSEARLMPVIGENRERDLIEGKDSNNQVKALNFEVQEEVHQMDLMLDHHLVMSLQTDWEQAREF